MEVAANAIMFHHFTDGNIYPTGQGAITAQDFERIIVGDGSYKMLSAGTWLEKFKAGNLKKQELCLTFDDNLKCQYDIALPVLEKFNLTAFWFVYTSPFLGLLPNLEIFRWFRLTSFENSDEFSSEFTKLAKCHFPDQTSRGLAEFEKSNYLQEFLFYGQSDREFRYLRDNVFSKNDYDFLMFELMDLKEFDWREIVPYLSFNEAELESLIDRGHVIGLHSHSHPTNMAQLDEAIQFTEYSKNKTLLQKFTKSEITCMAHPVNSYNEVTKKLLCEMGIELGFRSNPLKPNTTHPLEVGRIDHVEILECLCN